MTDYILILYDKSGKEIYRRNILENEIKSSNFPGLAHFEFSLDGAPEESVAYKIVDNEGNDLPFIEPEP